LKTRMIYSYLNKWSQVGREQNTESQRHPSCFLDTGPHSVFALISSFFVSQVQLESRPFCRRLVNLRCYQTTKNCGYMQLLTLLLYENTCWLWRCVLYPLQRWMCEEKDAFVSRIRISMQHVAHTKTGRAE